MWWLAVLNWDINQMWHSELAHDSGSVVCDGAEYIFKEPFLLLFRATLRKLRPEDMFETWVSTREDEALCPLLASKQKQTHSGYQTAAPKPQPLAKQTKLHFPRSIKS